MRTRQYPIALNLPKCVALVIVFGRYIVQKMTANAWFPTPDPDLPTVSDHLDQLEVSEAATKDRTRGAAAARDLDQKVVEADLKALKAYVARIVSQNPGCESAIIESAGMAEKGYTRAQKPELAATLGPGQGEIRVVAKAQGKRVSYEWQYSTDNGATWVSMGSSTVANISLQGATAGTTYLFRFRTTRRHTTSDWSPTVRLAVH